MDKEWLERRLYKRVGTIYGVQEKTEDVDAIAAQHEQDVASLVAVRDMYAIEIEGLQAQVAVMSTVLSKLEWIDAFCEDIGDSNAEGGFVICCPVCDAVKDAEEHSPDCWLANALSAAPKVWRVQGRTSLHYDIEVMAEGAPDEFRQLLIDRGMFAAWDVMVCLPPGEQPEESEQEEG